MPRETDRRAPARHRVGVYNADNHRPVEGPRDIVALVREYDLDLAGITEAAGYARKVRRELRRTHRVFTGRGSRSRRDSMVIARRERGARSKRVHSLSTGPWERAPRNRRFGLHPGRHMVSSLVGKGATRFRFGVPHLPPGPHDSDAYPLRARAHRRGLAKLATIVGRWGRQVTGRWALGTDANAPASRGDMKAWLEQVDATAKPRHVIDYLIASEGVAISDVERIEHGTGDHKHAVVATLTITPQEKP